MKKDLTHKSEDRIGIWKNRGKFPEKNFKTLNSYYKFFIIISFLSSLFGGVLAEEDKIPESVSLERFFLDYTVSNKIPLTDLKWRFKSGDNPEWSKTSYDDSGWKTIRVGESWKKQGFPEKTGWYRLHINIPENWEGKTLSVYLGPIANADYTYFNGCLIGSYGHCSPFYPKAPSRKVQMPINDGSYEERRYLINSELVNAGKDNVLAIKVEPGNLAGLYYGPVTIGPVKEEYLIDFNLKKEGKDSPLIYLSHATYLNHFWRNTPIKCSPRIMRLNDKSPADITFTIKISDKDSVILSEKRKLRTELFKWKNEFPFTLNISKPGNYTCSFQIDGKEICKTQLTVGENPPPIKVKTKKKFSDTNISWNKRKIYEEAVGHLGNTLYNAKNQLYNNMSYANANGNLCFCSLVNSREKVPYIFWVDVKKTPRQIIPPEKIRKDSAFKIYDGGNNIWSFGYVSPASNILHSKVKSKAANWLEREYVYNVETDEGKYFFEFNQNSLSPAYHVRTDAKEINAFDRIKESGVGLPKYIAFQGPNGICVREASSGIKTEELTANWVLCWFNGSKGWDEFDAPWIFVIQKKPESVKTDESSFTFKYGRPAGHFWGMPLFGVRLLSLYETEKWVNGLPHDVVELCKFWSKSLLSYPKNCKEEYFIDFKNDIVTIHDSFDFLEVSDEWNTSSIMAAPLSPVLAIAADKGFPVIFSDEIFDPGITALYGPCVYVKNKNNYTYRISGMLKYVTEVRRIYNVDKRSPVYAEVQPLLENALKNSWNKFDLGKQPWTNRNIVKKKASVLLPGSVEPFLSNLILALPYMDKDMGEKYRKAIANQVKLSILNFNDLIYLNDMETGKGFAMTLAHNREGIDIPTYTALRLYAAWQYADAFDDWESIRKNWMSIKKIFDIFPHAHDWVINGCWDSYSGIRIGNGIQESGPIHAALVSVARMAYKVGDADIVNYASYLAVKQLINIYTAAKGIEYFRDNRQYLLGNTEAGKIGNSEKKLKCRYIEYNEFAGSSQNYVWDHRLLTSLFSFIMVPLPEVMRPYLELFPEESKYFFNNAMPSKHQGNFFWLKRGCRKQYTDGLKYMIGIENTELLLKAMHRHFSEYGFNSDGDQYYFQQLNSIIADTRAVLDSLGKIKYENVMPEKNSL